MTELRKRGVDEGRRITASFASYSAAVVEEQMDAFEDTYIWNNFDNNYDGDEWKALLADYKEDHDGNVPDNNIVADLYNAVYAWKSCIEELELAPESDDLKQERKKMTSWFYNSAIQHGVQGDYQWVDGKKKADVYYFQYDKEGELELVN